MGFLDNVKKTMGEVSKETSSEKLLDKSNDKIKLQVETLLFEGEEITKIFGSELGFAGVTNKRVLVGTNFPSSTTPGKAISFIPYAKITSVDYEYSWSLVLKKYRVNIGVSSKDYEVDFYKKEDAIAFHKSLSLILIEKQPY